MTANIVFIRIIKLMSFNSLSFALNYPILRSFYDELNKFISLNPQKKKKNHKKKKKKKKKKKPVEKKKKGYV